MRCFKRSLEVQMEIHQLIPGGAHTYAKGDDQYPEFQPPYLVKGKGCRVWDVDGNEYIEYGMGLRAVTLGHAFSEVNKAAYRQMESGNNFARPAVIELEAARTFLDLVPGADMVNFTKNGSDATTAAVKLARAYTGKEMVAICIDHPFFSVDDWFIGSTPMDAGIPDGIKELTVSFRFNDIDSVRQLFRLFPDRLACFIMEIEKYDPIDLHFMQELQELCEQHNTLLILDEMITGFRWNLGGAQSLYGITPDLSTFGKAMGNGFAISALAGKREIMELGGLCHEKEKVFLLSTTHGAEHSALAAFLAIVDVYKREPVIEHMKIQGERLRKGIEQSIAENDLTGYVGVHGFPFNLVYSTRDQHQLSSQPFRTLLLQELLQRGVLSPSLVISYAHKEADVDQTIEIFHEALIVYRKALTEGIEGYLQGRSVQPVFRKWNFEFQNAS